MVRRITLPCLSRYVIITVVILLWCTWWQRSQLPSHFQSPRATKKIHLLILSSWQSGSTFVGHLFNQNPSVFYLVEPIRAVWYSINNENLSLLHRPMADVLRSIFFCNMSALKPYLPQSQFVSNLYGWSSSRALCSPPACDNFQDLNVKEGHECYHICHFNPFEKIEEACKMHSHIVIKEVHFLELKVLFPLLTDPQLNLRIIHLVRDPRAIFVSRQITRGLNGDDTIISGSHNSTANIYTVMKVICSAQVKIYQTALQEFPPSLKGHYEIVRYEDLLRGPMPYARQWYDSMGLTVLPRLNSWLDNNIHWLGIQNGVADFSKTSSYAAEVWRKKLSFQKVQAIQNMCRQEMETFGYRLIKSKEELADQTFDVLLPQNSESDVDTYTDTLALMTT